jgi:NAD(P)-dependent dehydrogenase (short-subunit alcohol dehydrogenase family)
MMLQGKRALITGGARGLGAAIAQAFASEGARVAFTYARNEAAAEEVSARVRAAGSEARAFKVSVLDTRATDAMVRDLEATWGGIDILVNNAGISQALPLALLEEEDWDKVLDTNTKGPFLTSRQVLRGMIRRKSGVVLTIGSLAGERMMEAPIHYCASKAALRGLTEALAKEVARYGIRVLCLAPGLLAEGMGQTLADYRMTEYLRHCSLRRLGELEEIAKLAAFLVSDLNSYMSGETIVADGGVN